MPFDQAELAVRFEWGPYGLKELAPISDVVIIVDVLSFPTAVDIAVANEAIILPYPSRDESAAKYASRWNAKLAATMRTGASFSLSPTSLLKIPKKQRLVLPSPNGGAVAFRASGARIFTACLPEQLRGKRFCRAPGLPVCRDRRRRALAGRGTAPRRGRLGGRGRRAFRLYHDPLARMGQPSRACTLGEARMTTCPRSRSTGLPACVHRHAAKQEAQCSH